MRIRFLTKFVALAVGMVSVALATPKTDSSLVAIRASVDKSVITIGDRITYTLEISHQKGVRIVEPGPGVNLGMFEIKDYWIQKPQVQGDQVIEKYQYFISVYDTGHFVIPPFPVAFFPNDTTTHPHIIKSEAIPIYVKSVLSKADEALRDIKPPVEIPLDYRRWIWMVLAGFLFVGLIILGLWYWRRRQQGQPVFRREVIRPAHEMALEELNQLLSSPLKSQKRWKDFFTILSEILRRYVERRFFIPAMENTSTELLQSLCELDISKENRDVLADVLNLADLVKFASHIPTTQQVDMAIEKTRTFIEKTRLTFTPVEVQEAVSADQNPKSN